MECFRVLCYQSPYKMNSITSSISGVDTPLYVDDFGASYMFKHMQAITWPLQLHPNRIENWADKKDFRFSKSKTFLLLNTFQANHLFILQSYMFYTKLLLGLKWQMIMKGVSSFSQIQSLPFRPLAAETGCILFSLKYWNKTCLLRRVTNIPITLDDFKKYINHFLKHK